MLGFSLASASSEALTVRLPSDRQPAAMAALHRRPSPRPAVVHARPSRPHTPALIPLLHIYVPTEATSATSSLTRQMT